MAELYAKRQRRNGVHKLVRSEDEQELVQQSTEAALQELMTNPKFKKHMAK